MLHTFNCSPWKYNIEEMLRMIKKNDDLLLIQDGVLGAIGGNNFITKLINLPIVPCALKEDIEARGIINQISIKINIVDYNYFVYLTTKHINQMNW